MQANNPMSGELSPLDPLRQIQNPGPGYAPKFLIFIKMSNYTVIHIEKRPVISATLEKHITRENVMYIDGFRQVSVFVPDNAQPERTILNKEYMSRKYVDENGRSKTYTLQQMINKRISECGIKVRKGQSRSLEIIFGGSPEALSSLSPEQLDQWARDTIEWAKNEWGAENVMYAALHMDESTPHLHLIVVPIVKGVSRRSASKAAQDSKKGIERKSYSKDPQKLRLSANDVYTKSRLYGYHTSYAKIVGKKYGLQRGIRAEAGSVKKHQSSIEYNRALENETRVKERRIEGLDEAIAERENIIRELQKQEAQTGAVLSAKLEELESGAGECTPPKKGFLGYRTEDVEKYIAATQQALAIKEPAMLHANTKQIMRIIDDLRTQQAKDKREINKILSSPDLLKRWQAKLEKKEKLKQMKQERNHKKL